MSMCRVFSCVVGRGCLLLTSVFSWQNSISLWPASFCTPRTNLPVTPGVSWLPSFAFQSSIMKRTSFWGVSSKVSQSYGFSDSHIWMWELDYKERWAPKNWSFWTVVLEERLMRVPWTSRRSNQSILKKSVPNIHWKVSCWSWNSNT